MEFLTTKLKHTSEVLMNNFHGTKTIQNQYLKYSISWTSTNKPSNSKSLASKEKGRGSSYLRRWFLATFLWSHKLKMDWNGEGLNFVPQGWKKKCHGQKERKEWVCDLFSKSKCDQKSTKWWFCFILALGSNRIKF